jgi:hypothetical protein
MIAIMLIAGLALVLAIGLGAWIAPSAHALTEHSQDWAWQRLPACPGAGFP